MKLTKKEIEFLSEQRHTKVCLDCWVYYFRRKFEIYMTQPITKMEGRTPFTFLFEYRNFKPCPHIERHIHLSSKKFESPGNYMEKTRYFFIFIL